MPVRGNLYLITMIFFRCRKRRHSAKQPRNGRLRRKSRICLMKAECEAIGEKRRSRISTLQRKISCERAHKATGIKIIELCSRRNRERMYAVLLLLGDSEYRKSRFYLYIKLRRKYMKQLRSLYRCMDTSLTE